MTSSTLLAASGPRPRVEGFPTDRDGLPLIVGTLGDLAIELARRAGLILDPWQQDSLRLMMAVRADGLWACREFCEWVPRQNGKGALLEARALAGFLLLGEKLIMWSAHELKTTTRAFRRMRQLIRKLGVRVKAGTRDEDALWDIPIEPGRTIRVKITSGNQDRGLERLDTEAQVLFIARSKASGRGFDGDTNIIDETFALTTEQQESLGPTMRAKPNPQVIYVSTPPLNGDSGEIMFELRLRAEDGDFVRLGYRDWGLAGDLDHLDEINQRDPKSWVATNPAHEVGRITMEDLEHDFRSMRARGGLGFCREILGVWPLPRTVAGGSISWRDWEDVLLDPESVRDKAAECALGVDRSLEGDYAAIFLYGLRNDELGHGQLVDYLPDLDLVPARLALLKDVLDPVGIGMMRGTFEYFKDDLAALGLTPPVDAASPARGDLLVLGLADSAAACGKLLDATRRSTIRIKPDPERPEILNDAVRGAKTRRSGETIVWSRKDPDDEPSPVVAMTAARFTYYRRINVVSANYGPSMPVTNTAPAGGDRSLFRPTERLNI